MTKLEIERFERIARAMRSEAEDIAEAVKSLTSPEGDAVRELVAFMFEHLKLMDSDLASAKH